MAERIADARSVAILRSEQLELIRVVLRAGHEIPKHQVDGEITFLCIEGRFQFGTGNGDFQLDPGDLIHLTRGEPHWVRAVHDASALLTICRPKR